MIHGFSKLPHGFVKIVTHIQCGQFSRTQVGRSNLDSSAEENFQRALNPWTETFFSNSPISGTKRLRHQKWVLNGRLLRELNSKPIFESVTPSMNSGKKENVPDYIGLTPKFVSKCD